MTPSTTSTARRHTTRRWRVAAGAALVLPGALLGFAAGAQASQPSPAAAPMWAVLTTYNSGSDVRLVSVDPGSGRLSKPIALPGSSRELLALAPDDEHAYVVDAPMPGKPSVLPVDLATGKAGTPIVLTHAGEDFLASSAAFSPDGSTLYLADAGEGTLIPVDVATGHAEPAIPIAPMAACGDVVSHVAVSGSGSTAYIESLGSFYTVNLAARRTSKPFHVATFEAQSSYKPPLSIFGDPTMGLSPNGTTLWALQTGQHADLLVPIATSGDHDGTAISVPVAARPHWPNVGEEPEPSWDGLDVVSNSSALVIAYGAKPESIIPVDLVTRKVGRTIAISTLKAGTVCGDSVPLPVGITANGSTAVVGATTSAGAASIHLVDLVTGTTGPSIPLGDGQVRDILSPSGYCDWIYPAAWQTVSLAGGGSS